jgi:outer membrane protein OmpA-like peptidoglycan-associated protein
MKLQILRLSCALIFLSGVHPLRAQTAAPLDAAAAKATLSEQAEKPKFRPKAAVQGRSYTRNAKGVDVEIVEYASGQKEEHPYVPVPLLFKVDSDELLDDGSRRNLRELAAILHDLSATGARFVIQGHTSAEGNADHNRTLSDKRAQRIRALLVEGLGVPADAVKETVGFGSEFARVPANAPESSRQQDRRVLVIRD